MHAATASPALARLTALAARLVGASSAQVSLLTDVQTVAAAAGLVEGTVGRSGPLNESLCTVTAKAGAVLHVTDAAADERVADLPPVTSGQVGSYLGAPLRTSGGHVVGALCVFDRAARSWSQRDVDVVEVLAESVITELELSALSSDYEYGQLRWDVARDAADLGSFDIDLRTGRITCDERMSAIYGLVPGTTTISRTEVLERVHPEDREFVAAAFAAAVRSVGRYRVDYRVVHPGGETRWVTVRGRVRADAEGRAAQLVGVTYDTTETRNARDQAADLLASMTAGFLAVDADWRVSYLNRAGERILGHGADEAVGRVLWEVFPGLDGLRAGGQHRQSLETGEPVELEVHQAQLGSWFEVRAVPSEVGLALYFLDVTAQHRAMAAADDARVTALAMQAQAEAAAERLAMLAEVSAELSGTLDAEEAVSRLTRLVVPSLADWSIVSIVDDDGSLRDLGCSHFDPAMRPVVERLAETRFAKQLGPGPVQRALSSGEVVATRDDAVGRAAAFLGPSPALDAVRQLAPRSSVAVPLTARGRVVGALSLFRGASRQPMSDEAIATARQVADRAAMALDNARLYNQQRTLAEHLQRSLLTAPPEPDHVHIVVRYVPAASGASVGGDWYDSFLQDDGATVLVIGDVVGHDTHAAGAMGQLRGLLRGIAWSSGGGPASVLSRLDAAIAGLGLSTVASAVVARIEQGDAERANATRTLRWSNAGHPPPLVLRPDGSVVILEPADAELLLGIDESSSRSETTMAIEEGTTILLYTDGLVERRDEHLSDGLGRLGRAVADLAGLPLDDLCDQLVGRLIEGRPDDDVALVAVRLHPQDRPRPDEAGPVVLPEGGPSLEATK